MTFEFIWIQINQKISQRDKKRRNAFALRQVRFETRVGSRFGFYPCRLAERDSPVEPGVGNKQGIDQGQPTCGKALDFGFGAGACGNGDDFQTGARLGCDHRDIQPSRIAKTKGENPALDSIPPSRTNVSPQFAFLHIHQIF